MNQKGVGGGHEIMTWCGCGCGLGILKGAAEDITRTGLVRYPLRHIGDLFAKTSRVSRCSFCILQGLVWALVGVAMG